MSIAVGGGDKKKEFTRIAGRKGSTLKHEVLKIEEGDRPQNYKVQKVHRLE